MLSDRRKVQSLFRDEINTRCWLKAKTLSIVPRKEIYVNQIAIWLERWMRYRDDHGIPELLYRIVLLPKIGSCRITGAADSAPAPHHRPLRRQASLADSGQFSGRMDGFGCRFLPGKQPSC